MDETIARFLRAKGRDLAVPDKEKIVIDPESERFRANAHHLEVRSFEDLQALSLIPTRLKEEAVRKAIALDDRLALDGTRDRMRAVARPCDCEETADFQPSSKTLVRRSLSQEYAALRRAHHPELASAMSDSLSADVAWNSPVAASVYGFIKYVDVYKLMPIDAVLFQDIEVGKT